WGAATVPLARAMSLRLAIGHELWHSSLRKEGEPDVHTDLLDGRLGGRLYRRPRGRVLMVGAQRGSVSFPHRADTRAWGLSVGPQALRDDAGVGDGSVDARQRARRRVRRRLVRDPEDRLQ